MTEEQLEIAARKLCKLRMRDPDELMPHGVVDKNGVSNLVLYHSPYIKFVKQELRILSAQLEAIEFTKGTAS